MITSSVGVVITSVTVAVLVELVVLIVLIVLAELLGSMVMVVVLVVAAGRVKVWNVEGVVVRVFCRVVVRVIIVTSALELVGGCTVIVIVTVASSSLLAEVDDVGTAALVAIDDVLVVLVVLVGRGSCSMEDSSVDVEARVVDAVAAGVVDAVLVVESAPVGVTSGTSTPKTCSTVALFQQPTCTPAVIFIGSA